MALIGLAGSGLGAFGGVVASARLTQYRLKRLEEKVQAHNHLIERTFTVQKMHFFLGEQGLQDFR